MVQLSLSLLLAASSTALAFSNSIFPRAVDPLASCPGYKASNVKTSATGLTADLTLAGAACNVYGTDLKELTLTVTYEESDRLHVIIQDPANSVYQVPASVFTRPGGSSPSSKSELKFTYTASPFSFAIKRTSTDEVLFDTSAAHIVFESQYVRLRTKLPDNPNLYGLGEHSDPFRLNTTNYIRTLWSSDAYSIPYGNNLYGNHPIYYEHRTSGSHGVLFANSNGMDIMLNNTGVAGSQYLEYNTLGGVLDFYFLPGDSPVDVARQYAKTVGLPAMMPYWGFGFHNCRYGYQDAYDVAEAVYNYSVAGIPLETMWTDIDYMDARKVFSLDPQRFSLDMMQDLVHHLHANNQHYVLMVDPAVAYQNYGPFNRGVSDDIFLLRSNGSIWKGVVWPGVTAFPDWFSANAQSYWNNEFTLFFNPTTGVDIDALWIDMNEPSNFPCNFPCDDPDAAAVGFPPTPPAVRTPPRPLPGWPCPFQPPGTPCTGTKAKREPEAEQILVGRMTERSEIEDRQAAGKELGLPGRDLLYPKYAIHNAQAFTVEDNAAGGGISNHTVNTNIIHQNGLAMYDTHNMFGTMMSSASRAALLNRRPTVRPMVITRSTFIGAGAHVGHWLGDNLSDWPHYRISIRTMMAFASIYQVPMVGSDVCGYADDTNEQLCARWAMLGAFSPFYRNHNSNPPTIPQEFYRWASVTEAAKKVIDVRYRLLDYIYTAMWQQTQDGTPLINPMFYVYPKDPNTFGLEMQYFFGPGVLIAPVQDENATSVEIYFPKEIYYDLWTYKPLTGSGSLVTVSGLGWTDMPLYFRGGVIFPMRVESAMTTTELRTKDFDIVIAVGLHGAATGQLYLDDGDSLVQAATTLLKFTYHNGEFTVKGNYGYHQSAKIASITVLGLTKTPGGCSINGANTQGKFNQTSSSYSVLVNKPITADFSVSFN